MSKSLGNVVVPDDVISQYGVDALRFYLSHQIPVGNDGDFSWARFADIYNGVLRAQIGNLLNRVLTLLKKEGGKLGSLKANAVSELRERAQQDWAQYSVFMDAFEMHAGIASVTGATDLSNKLMQKTEPWKKEGTDKTNTLTSFAEALRHIALMLLPFTPDTAQKISAQLGVPYADKMLERDFVITDALRQWGGAEGWTTIGEPTILFPPVEVEK